MGSDVDAMNTERSLRLLLSDWLVDARVWERERASIRTSIQFIDRRNSNNGIDDNDEINVRRTFPYLSHLKTELTEIMPVLSLRGILRLERRYRLFKYAFVHRTAIILTVALLSLLLYCIARA